MPEQRPELTLSTLSGRSDPKIPRQLRQDAAKVPLIPEEGQDRNDAWPYDMARTEQRQSMCLVVSVVMVSLYLCAAMSAQSTRLGAQVCQL
jgi:hypothetical protein